MEEDFRNGPKEGIEAVEWARTEYYKRYRKDMGVVVGIAVVALGLAVMEAIKSGELFGLFFVVVVISFGVTIVSVKNAAGYERYRLAYKKYFVQGMMSQVLPGCEYQHLGAIKKGEIAEIGMMNMGDRYTSEDLVTGEYNGVKFRQADVEIEEEKTDDDGKTRYITIFKGRYAIFDIKKNFSFRMAVVGNGFRGKQLRNRDEFKQFKKRTVESGEFNKRFDVYAEDGFEAFYLLDPAIIERMERLGGRHDDKVAIFFYKGFMHVAIGDYSDAFEPPRASKPVSEGAELGKVREEFKVLTDLVDGLKLAGE